MKIERFNEASNLMSEMQQIRNALNSFYFEYEKRKLKNNFNIELTISDCKITREINRIDEFKELLQDKIDIIINEIKEELEYKLRELEKDFKDL